MIQHHNHPPTSPSPMTTASTQRMVGCHENSHKRAKLRTLASRGQHHMSFSANTISCERSQHPRKKPELFSTGIRCVSFAETPSKLCEPRSNNRRYKHNPDYKLTGQNTVKRSMVHRSKQPNLGKLDNHSILSPMHYR